MVDLLPSMRLLDADTDEELILAPAASNGGVIKLVDFNPGFPEVRRVQYQNPGWNGATDYTRLHGAKAVALVLKLDPSAGVPIMATLSTLRAWVAAGRDVLLYYTPSGMDGAGAVPARRPAGRRPAHAVDRVRRRRRAAAVVLPGRCRVLAGTTQTTVMLQTPLTTGGRTYPLIYPRTYPAQTGTGVASSPTTAPPTAPVVRIFGPSPARF
jgi:hypothetical protein